MLPPLRNFIAYSPVYTEGMVVVDAVVVDAVGGNVGEPSSAADQLIATLAFELSD